ncbi:aromatic ring-hydroxylating dioxygenase subunit alpha [Hydrogenophaga sp. XSHU_21]
MNAPQALVRWHDRGTSRIPFWAYTDPDLYQRELERLFHGPHWCYVGLAIEIPEAGDYKLSWVGERQVIMVRDRVAPKDRGTDHGIRVVENRCAHRGVRFCQPPMDGQVGKARNFVCPYHQWTYKLNGDLAGLPFKDGVKDGDCVNGGMPADFDLSKNGLTKLRVGVLHGLVFATFSDEAEPLEDYLGAELKPWLDRIFQGRELKLLGYNRQRIPGNWKLMMENIKDPYHPGLLHTWFVTFGLWRADQKSRMVMDSHGRHAVMISRRNDGGANQAVTSGVTSFKADMKLNDPRLLDVVPEPWWTIDDPQNPGATITPTVTMITLFPSVIIQQQVNSLSTRHIVPRGPNEFDFVWTHFGFADDDEAMTTRRLRQANLFGPAGFVSADDGEVIEFSQDGFRQWGEGGSTLVELGGKGDDVGQAPTEHMVTETLIRSMYAYWRKAMNL